MIDSGGSVLRFCFRNILSDERGGSMQGLVPFAQKVAGSNPTLAPRMDVGQVLHFQLRFGVLTSTQYQCCSRERL